MWRFITFSLTIISKSKKLLTYSVPPIPWYRYRYRYRYPAEDPYRYRYRYPKIKPIPIPDTDTQNSYRYRYQIPIPSLRFIPIPIPISEKSTDTRSYTDIYTDISVWNRYTDTDIQNPYRYRYLNFISYWYRYIGIWYTDTDISVSGIGKNIGIGGTLQKKDPQYMDHWYY